MKAVCTIVNKRGNDNLKGKKQGLMVNERSMTLSQESTSALGQASVWRCVVRDISVVDDHPALAVLFQVNPAVLPNGPGRHLSVFRSNQTLCDLSKQLYIVTGRHKPTKTDQHMILLVEVEQVRTSTECPLKTVKPKCPP